MAHLQAAFVPHIPGYCRGRPGLGGGAARVTQCAGRSRNTSLHLGQQRGKRWAPATVPDHKIAAIHSGTATKGSEP